MKIDHQGDDHELIASCLIEIASLRRINQTLKFIFWRASGLLLLIKMPLFAQWDNLFVYRTIPGF